MLQGRPEIHGDGADLDLHLGILLSVRQIHRDRHHHMVALIAVGFWIFNIVFDVEHRNIRLPGDHIRDGINIRHKRTDNADPRNIVQVLHHIFNRNLPSVMLQLFYDAGRRF